MGSEGNADGSTGAGKGGKGWSKTGCRRGGKMDKGGDEKGVEQESEATFKVQEVS